MNLNRPIALFFKVTLGLSLAAAGGAHAVDDVSIATQSPSPPAHVHSQAPAPATVLDNRVRLLAAELNLDSTQQVEVKKLLALQRDQIARVWNDPEVPAVYRIKATRAISEHTSEQIRSLLTPEQKQKYQSVSPNRELPDQDPKHDAEYWMNAARAKS